MCKVGYLFFKFLFIVSWSSSGGVLSLYLFAVFVDDIVYKVQMSNVGCYISSMCACIYLYADDILLLAPTVAGLQHILNVSEDELQQLHMCVNVKTVHLRFTAIST